MKILNFEVKLSLHVMFLLQDFVRHFHVLMPHGTTPTKSGVREFFRRSHLPPAGYQVGNTMVQIPNDFSSNACVFCIAAVLTRTCTYAGVPARGRASAPPDTPSPGGPAANRRAAAPLQSRPGEEALCPHEAGCLHHPGEIEITMHEISIKYLLTRIYQQIHLLKNDLLLLQHDY